MKDQYTGDINDFWKYAILRTFERAWPGRLHVCWMLTPPVERSDGGQISYLSEPDLYRRIDPILFDKLASLFGSARRTVAHVQAAGILPGARFHSALLSDALPGRTSYFEALWAETTRDDLLFFDPDNGVEVSSVAKGRRGSSRYLFWDEIAMALRSSGAVCIYQHFPRIEREPFASRLLSKGLELVSRTQGFALYSPRVVYLLLAKDRPINALAEGARRLADLGEGLRLILA